MSNTNNQDRQLYLGIDGGGSKCRAIVYCAEQGVLGRGLSGPANVLRGIELATKHIIEATEQALLEAGLSSADKAKLIAGIGLAGLNLECCKLEIKDWQHPFKSAYFTSDLHIACIGAHGGKNGAVIIAGTGSSGLASFQNEIIEVGGHGFPVGDCGSGAWLGLKAIEITLQAADGLKPNTELTKAVLDTYRVEASTDLAQLAAGFQPVDFAKLAPMVIEYTNQQDLHAMHLLQMGVDYLSAMASRLTADNDLPLSLIGGLTPILAQHFDNSIRRRIKPAQQPPEIGAVLFAQFQSN